MARALGEGKGHWAHPGKGTGFTRARALGSPGQGHWVLLGKGTGFTRAGALGSPGQGHWAHPQGHWVHPGRGTGFTRAGALGSPGQGHWVLLGKGTGFRHWVHPANVVVVHPWAPCYWGLMEHLLEW